MAKMHKKNGKNDTKNGKNDTKTVKRHKNDENSKKW